MTLPRRATRLRSHSTCSPARRESGVSGKAVVVACGPRENSAFLHIHIRGAYTRLLVINATERPPFSPPPRGGCAHAAHVTPVGVGSILGHEVEGWKVLRRTAGERKATRDSVRVHRPVSSPSAAEPPFNPIKFLTFRRRRTDRTNSLDGARGSMKSKYVNVETIDSVEVAEWMMQRTSDVRRVSIVLQRRPSDVVYTLGRFELIFECCASSRALRLRGIG